MGRNPEPTQTSDVFRNAITIADELHVSTETVKHHTRDLFRALGVNSRLEAVAAARAAPSS